MSRVEYFIIMTIFNISVCFKHQDISNVKENKCANRLKENIHIWSSFNKVKCTFSSVDRHLLLFMKKESNLYQNRFLKWSQRLLIFTGTFKEFN